jgi:mono/diheme cytochrome c family protein
MRWILFLLSGFLLANLGISSARQNPTQEKPNSAGPTMTPEDVARKNPIAPTPEGLADARKFFGYSCAMCHGKDGDGKGDLAAEMKLELHNWHDPASIEKMTDGELFYIITNGKGKMPSQGDRSPERQRWNLVNLVRSFGKKGAAEKSKPDSPQP